MDIPNNMKLQKKLKELRNNRKAILATNFYNYETVKGILMAAKTAKQPLILQLSKSSINYLGLPVAFKLAESMLAFHEVEGWIHLDHGDSIELVEKCLDAGFNSVMIDASEKPFEENVKITRAVVRLAEKYGANVEAELGYVAKLGQSMETPGFTEPGEAKLFAEETGINALAVAIGSAHGFYKKRPELDLERLSEIRETTDVALVLHGGSGIPNVSLQEAIQSGICKINLATEIKDVYMKTLKGLLADEDEIDLRQVFPPATKAVTELVKNKLCILTP